jgi:hypothetical protein
MVLCLGAALALARDTRLLTASAPVAAPQPATVPLA